MLWNDINNRKKNTNTHTQKQKLSKYACFEPALLVFIDIEIDELRWMAQVG